MRMVCPNCGAQYEVDDRVIPETGRDVQCSACGHAWYQMPIGQRDAHDEAAEPDQDFTTDDEDLAPESDEKGADEASDGADEDEAKTAETETPAEAASQPDTQKPDDSPEPTEPEADAAASEAEPEAAGAESKPEAAGPETEPEAAESEGEPEAAEPESDSEPDHEPKGEPAAKAPKQREIDEEVRSILREEAEREMEVRTTEKSHAPEPVETQPDLGLEAGPSPEDERRRAARERLARMRGLDEDEVAQEAFSDSPEAVAEARHGRDLFPDIEEINSTLDSPGIEAESGGGYVAPKTSRGFGRGFVVVIFVAALLLSVYILAPRLAETLPALKPALTAYVEAVNAARAWLDEAMQGITRAIRERTTGGS